MRVKQILNPNLDFQINAIKSIVDIFKDVEFTYSKNPEILLNQDIFSLLRNSSSPFNPNIETSFWNNKILENIKKIQNTNHLDDVEFINEHQPVFDIEMETGTGKTYVYLRTILELFKKYNFKKFIIIVPNKAVKEAVQNNLKIYATHFNNLYSDVNYNYKYYNSNSLDVVWNFATNTGLEILIMNIQQINKMNENDKNSNVFYKSHEQLQGSNALKLIKDTNPILIIDEPQSTASGDKSIKAIRELNPSFVLRYSATFRKRHNEILMYKLDAVDAYNLNLVKKIDVLSCENRNNDDIVIKKFDSKTLSAIVELETLNNKLIWSVVKKKITKNTNLYALTNNIKYKGLVVDEINFKDKKIIFSNGKVITQGVVYDINIKSAQIKSTIEKHLDQQLKLLDKNIKVLSLFFIDKVNNYRVYKDNKTQQLGEYGIIFEKELRGLLINDKYKALLGNKSIDEYVKICHDGYFSIDSKGHFTDSLANGDSSRDQTTYEKIMKDKEKLLSFDEPLSFIFSHTALKEGWDNPNVFQICTLNETTSVAKMHQEIGRGLRLCVNQFGERIEDLDINRLTVVTNFSYKDFVESLQSEMRENGVNFGELNISSFISNDPNEYSRKISFEQSKKIYKYLIKQNIIDSKTKRLRLDYKDANKLKIVLLNAFTWESGELCDFVVNKLITSASRDFKITNAKNKIDNNLNRDVLLSYEFLHLWDKIKHKSEYIIKFDEDKFVNNVINKICEDIDTSIDQASVLIKRSEININHELGVVSSNNGIYDVYKYEPHNFDKKILTIVSDIEKETNLRRKTIVKILTNNKVLNVLQLSTNKILKFLIDTIKDEKRKLIYRDIEYKPINEVYDINRFEESVSIYYDDNLTYSVNNKFKYPYQYINTDSKVEFKLANDADNSDMVQVFIKLPSWYKIKTPDNTYNPDWSLLLKENKIVVAETKGSSDVLHLREIEKNKISCAAKHFKSISSNIQYEVDNNLSNLLKK